MYLNLGIRRAMSHSKNLHGGVLGWLLIWHFRETFPCFPLDFWTRPIKKHSDSDFEVHIPGRAGEPVLIDEKNLIGPFHFSLFGKKANLRKILKKFPRPGYRTRSLSIKELGFNSCTTEPTIIAYQFRYINLKAVFVSISKQAFVNKQMLLIGFYSSEWPKTIFLDDICKMLLKLIAQKVNTDFPILLPVWPLVGSQEQN